MTTAEAKTWLHVDFTDTNNDAAIDEMVLSAADMIEVYTGTAIISQTWELRMSQPGGDVDENLLSLDYPLDLAVPGTSGTINLPTSPLISVTSISTFDTDNTESTFSTDSYTVETLSRPGYVYLNSGASWPTGLRPRAGFRIVYLAGYANAAAVPKAIKTEIKTLVTEMYDNRGETVRGGQGGLSEIQVNSMQRRMAGFKVSRYGGA